jgi:hypothetical protein
MAETHPEPIATMPRGGVEQPEHAADGPQRGHPGEDSEDEGARSIDADPTKFYDGSRRPTPMLWMCCGYPVRPAGQKLTDDSLTGYIYARAMERVTRAASLKAEVRGR